MKAKFKLELPKDLLTYNKEKGTYTYESPVYVDSFDLGILRKVYQEREAIRRCVESEITKHLMASITVYHEECEKEII